MVLRAYIVAAAALISSEHQSTASTQSNNGLRYCIQYARLVRHEATVHANASLTITISTVDRLSLFSASEARLTATNVVAALVPIHGLYAERYSSSSR